MAWRVRRVDGVGAAGLGVLLAPVTLWLWAALPAAGATIPYTSGGFEAPRFTTGTLEGQDAASPWQREGTGGTGAVEGTTVQSGSRAVQLTRTSGDIRFFTSFSQASVVGTLLIDWDMNVTQSTHAGNFGPYFGVEAYDALGNAPLLAGSAGVDAKTGDVLYQAGGTGFLTESGVKVGFGVWNHFRLALNYTNSTYSVFVNGGAAIQNIGFVDAGVKDFSDAPLAALAADVEPPVETGTAFFDNYAVAPEPGSFGPIAVLAASVLLLRRCRRVYPVATADAAGLLKNVSCRRNYRCGLSG